MIAASVAAAIAPAAAMASPFDEIRAGVYAQGVGPLSTNKESGAGINAELLFKSPEALSFLLSPRINLGASIATDEDSTSQVYGGFVWQQTIARRYFIAAGAGLAVHNAETDLEPSDPDIATTKYLGCRVLFRFSGDLGYMLTDRLSASIHYDHISNAGLCSPNEGLENSGFRLGYRF
ncbi:MAG: acyloxyacyl hydrolase [Parvularculaceae bacterium]